MIGPYLRAGVTVGAALLIGLGAFSCGDAVDEPTDGSATAELRLFLEVDYVAGQLRQTEDYVDLWQEEVLWGVQVGSCGFMYGQSTSRIDLQKRIDDALQWGSSIGREAGISDYTDEVAILRDVSERLLVTEKTDSQDRPNLYLLIADHLIDKNEVSRDPDRSFDTYRFDDSALPPAADIMGFVTWPPENEFLGCDGDSYDYDSPVGVIFLGAVEKYVADVNVVLERSPFLEEPTGCGLTGASLVSFERVAAKVIGHELVHELGFLSDIPGMGGTPCHEATCQCILNGNLLRLVLKYGDKRVHPDDFNCDTAAQWIAAMHKLCIGEAADSHTDDFCEYDELKALNPVNYQ